MIDSTPAEPDWVRLMAVDADLSDGLTEVFVIDPDAWSPRKVVYAVAVDFAQSTRSNIPSPLAVYAALRARGFKETKRRGVWGFKGIYTAGRTDEPRVKPAGTATAYYHQNERTELARSAMYRRRFELKLFGYDPQYTNTTPWHDQTWDEQARAELARSGHRPRPPRLSWLSPNERPPFKSIDE